jgi:single-strand DNA-binding protein
LVGNLAAAPEIKPTSQGSKIARMRLITSETYKDRDGNRQEVSHGHTIVVFNERLVDVIESYGRKGQKVAITGKLENRSWTDSDDVKHYATEVVLPRYGGEFKMLSSASENTGGEGGESRAKPAGDDNRGGNRSDNRSDTRSERGGDNRGNGGGARSDSRPARDDSDLDDDVPF